MAKTKTKTPNRKPSWLQEAFARAYVQDPTNHALAARKAGYKGNENTNRKTAHQLLRNPIVTQRIAEIRAETTAVTQIDVKWCLEKAVQGHERCVEKDETNAKGYLDQVARMTGAFEADNRQRQTQIGMIIM